MKTKITAPEIERYIQNLYPAEDPVLREMEALAKKNDFPIIGPLVGRLLYQLTHMISAKRIFELGSGFGYSAFWFSLALPRDGQIFLTDGSKTNLKQAKDFLIKANLAHLATFHSGNALQILKKSSGPFDIILMDIDKEEYPKAIPIIKSKLCVGGLLITDNLLWSGRVLERSGEPSTMAIKKYNRNLFNDCDFISTLMPVRDGVGVSLRIN